MIEKGIEQLIEDSSLGTDEAKALRESISLERAREIVGLAERQAKADEDAARATDAEKRGQGICRTCCAPIWNEGGSVGHQRRDKGWSDRIERGGDSLVCFSAIDYRHVPLSGREAAIYDRAIARGLAAAVATTDGEQRLRDAIEALIEPHADDEHNDGCQGEPECPACWVADLRAALGADGP